MEFLKSQKGKRILRYKGYTYYSQYTGLKTRWLCSTHYPKGCRASIYTINDKVIKLTGEHNHAVKKKLQLMPKTTSIQGVYFPKYNIKYEPKSVPQCKEQKLSSIVQRNNQNVQQYLNINTDMKTEHLNLLSPIQSQQNVSTFITSPSTALVPSSFSIPRLMNPGSFSQYHGKDGQQSSFGDQILNRFDQSFYNYDERK